MARIIYALVTTPGIGSDLEFIFGNKTLIGRFSMQWSAQRARRNSAGRIYTPFVIGAIIELGNCLNLIEPDSISIVNEAYEELKKTVKDAGGKLPKNKDANRALDCAVIKYVHESNVRADRPAYDTIRSPFHEGGELYEGANFSKRLHMEVCVKNPRCIKGYFLPQPLEEFNPYLKKEFFGR